MCCLLNTFMRTNSEERYNSYHYVSMSDFCNIYTAKRIDRHVIKLSIAFRVAVILTICSSRELFIHLLIPIADYTGGVLLNKLPK